MKSSRGWEVKGFPFFVHLRVWRNWYTRQVKVLMFERTLRFESSHTHLTLKKVEQF